MGVRTMKWDKKGGEGVVGLLILSWEGDRMGGVSVLLISYPEISYGKGQCRLVTAI